MDGDRELSVLSGVDGWARCRHEGTALLPEGGVALSWLDPARPGGPPAPGDRAGLAFDRWCRAYRSWPAVGRVDVLDPGSPPPGRDDRPGPLRTPRALGTDAAERLYVLEAGAEAVRVVDLRAGRVRAVVRTTAGTPVDLAATCCGAVVLTRGPATVVRLAGGCVRHASGPVVRPCRTDADEPVRIAADGHDVLLLWPPAQGRPAVVARPDGAEVVRVPDADNLAVTPDGVLVVATGPGGPLRRFSRAAGGWAEIEPLEAPGYDGGAVTAGPGGRIAVTTCGGFAWALPARIGFPRGGRIVSYRLDAGDHRTRWGRMFLDACLPPGTRVRAGFLTSEDDEVPDPIAARPAERGMPPAPPDGTTPALPSESALAAQLTWTELYRRPGCEPPRATYEAPITGPPGRYLWLVLELSGTGRATPRVFGVRLERPGHGLQAALPRAWSRQERQAAFLHRFLAPAEGLLHDLDVRAAGRDALIDPARTDADRLGWLADLIGVDLDVRWPEAARRQLLAEAFLLYRSRGTLAFLERLLQLYLGVRPPIVERWRLRGFGGATLGAQPAGAPPPSVGGGIATGALGRFVIGGLSEGEDAYTAAAHRFTVVVPALLSNEQRAVVETIVARHKPAHTRADICEVGDGLRVGRRSHAGVTTVVAPGPARRPAVLGGAELGAVTAGQPETGSRIGAGTVVGRVAVG